MAAAAVSRTLFRSVRDLPPLPSRTVLLCGPPVLLALGSSSPFSEILSRQTGRCLQEHRWWLLHCTISSPIGCSSHRTTRLASCLSRAGPGSREFQAPTTRRWGGICHLPRAVPVPLDQDPAADASKRLLQNIIPLLMLIYIY